MEHPQREWESYIQYSSVCRTLCFLMVYFKQRCKQQLCVTPCLVHKNKETLSKFQVQLLKIQPCLKIKDMFPGELPDFELEMQGVHAGHSFFSDKIQIRPFLSHTVLYVHVNTYMEKCLSQYLMCYREKTLSDMMIFLRSAITIAL